MAQRSQSKAKGWQQPVLLLLRLLIVGAALGVITGTALKWLAPQLNTDVPLPPPVDTPPKPSASLGSFNPKRETKPSAAGWQRLQPPKRFEGGRLCVGAR